MPSHDDSHLELVVEYWRGGKALEAGRLVFENLPSDIRPTWASRILRLVLVKSGIRTFLFENVLETADHQAKWGNGHRVFSTLRSSTLELDDLGRKLGLTEQQKLLASILTLAELVAKVTYNATNPLAEFDQDSGWWIAACLKGFVNHQWPDDEFSQAAWLALCNRDRWVEV